MGHTHSQPGGAESAGAALAVVKDLLRRHIVSGDTPFHRAVKGSNNGAAARRRLEALCDAVLTHHQVLLQHVLQHSSEDTSSAASGLRALSLWQCTGGQWLTDEAEDQDQQHRPLSDQRLPTTATELLRRLLDMQNNKGQTALHMAAEVGYAEVVELLLEQGANPWLTDRMGKHMPIHLACMRARLPCIKLFLDQLPAQWWRSPRDESLCYVEAPTVSGFTPLHCVVASTDGACIRAVLSHHPRLEVTNQWDSWEYQLEYPRGTTAMHVAASKGSQDAAKELLRHYNNMVLSTRGRLVPVPSPSVFGGHMPTLGAPTPHDPRLAVNSLGQLPWQVAYSMHLRSLAEILHPSLPLTMIFPVPPVMTLQSLASEVLRQKLMHTLEAAKEAEDRQREQRILRLRQEVEEDKEREEERRRVQHPRSLPIARGPHSATAAAGAASSSGVAAFARSLPTSTAVASARTLMGTSGSDVKFTSLTKLKNVFRSRVSNNTDDDEQEGPRSRSSAERTASASGPTAESRCPEHDQDGHCTPGHHEELVAASGLHPQVLAAALLQQPRCIAPAAPAAVATSEPTSPAAAPTASAAPQRRTLVLSTLSVNAALTKGRCIAPGDADRQAWSTNGNKQQHDFAQCKQHSFAADLAHAQYDAAFKAPQHDVLNVAGDQSAHDDEGDLHRESCMCAVCLDAEARMQVVPCAHRVCAGCAQELVRNMTLKPLDCPLCRAHVRGFTTAAAAGRAPVYTQPA